MVWVGGGLESVENDGRGDIDIEKHRPFRGSVGGQVRYRRIESVADAARVEHESRTWPLEDQPLVARWVFGLGHRMKPVVHESLEPVNDRLAGFRVFHGLHELSNEIVIAQFEARLANAAVFGNGAVAAFEGADVFGCHGCGVVTNAQGQIVVSVVGGIGTWPDD